jgi:hypothetical protein
MHQGYPSHWWSLHGYASVFFNSNPKVLIICAQADVPCPPNSQGHPDCICESKFGGEVQWVGDHYEGECSPCAPGFTSTMDTKDCHGELAAMQEKQHLILH